ncbi:MAG: hypothetical protein AAF297_05025, partial [Planctomycetota bacterium]
MHRTLATAALGLLSAAPLSAQVFVSAEVTTDTFVTIDTGTMEVTAVASLPFDATKVEFAWFEGTLYAIAAGDRFDGTNLELFEVDPITGQFDFIAQVPELFSAGSFLRGMTADDDGLVVLLSSSGVPFRPSLHRLNHITGQLTLAYDFPCSRNIRRGRDIEVDPAT